jgi:hypothetical protein
MKSISPIVAAYTNEKTIVLLSINNENRIIKKEIDTKGNTNLKFITFSDDGTHLIYSSENVKILRN